MPPQPFPEPPFLVFPSREGGFRLYANPESLWPGESLPEAETRAASIGAHIAGGLRYSSAEGSAPGFWGVFPDFRVLDSDELSDIASPSPVFVGPLKADMDEAMHAFAFHRIKEALSEGDAYQANLTFALRGKAASAYPWSWRCALRLWLDLLEPGGDRTAGQGREACFAATDSGEIVASLSPELFFSIDGDSIRARPMKGTAVRGEDPASDELLRQGLERSPKDRAENLMITDMIRNDLGRIALPGSVKVGAAFTTEAYPTLWQMTSSVEAVLPRGASLSSAMAALFPCASITGAPKIASQGIIAETESGERGWYTGCLGWYSPGSAGSGKAAGSFSVLIRSLVFPFPDKPEFSLGVGGGIVWDSEPGREYREALSKARFLLPAARRFDLLESMLWEKEGGFFLLDLHSERLSAACAAFGGSLDAFEFEEKARAAVEARLKSGMADSLKVRILVGPDFSLRAEAEEPSPIPEIMRCAISERPLGPDSLAYRVFKTTDRSVYSGASDRGLDQLLFLNERGELTEATSMNIVLKLDGRFITPAASSGLLEGTFRRSLLREGKIVEGILRAGDLERAEEIWLVNSVRRWVRARLIP